MTRLASGEPTWALIAGGGTAGHVLPGIAIAQALVVAGHPPASIHFVGSTAGMEGDLVPEAGFGVTLLPGRGIQRRLTADNVAAGWGLLRASLTALDIVRRRRPAVVVSLGGYASLPCAAAAGLLRVPVVVHEQNAVPGAANRVVSRFAKACAVSFPGTALPRATLTGNPVRPDVLAIDRQRDRTDARKRLGIPEERKLLAVFGGSLGARRINQAVLNSLQAWQHRGDLAVRHVVGRRDWAMIHGATSSLPRGELVYQAVDYEPRMDLLLAAADLALCRAGATTIAELTAVGLPALLVPLPGAPGDHQTANARYLERAGAAVVLADGQLDAEQVVGEVDRLIDDPARLAAMRQAAASCARRDAAQLVAGLVERHARDTDLNSD